MSNENLNGLDIRWHIFIGKEGSLRYLKNITQIYALRVLRFQTSKKLTNVNWMKHPNKSIAHDHSSR